MSAIESGAASLAAAINSLNLRRLELSDYTRRYLGYYQAHLMPMLQLHVHLLWHAPAKDRIDPKQAVPVGCAGRSERLLPLPRHLVATAEASALKAHDCLLHSLPEVTTHHDTALLDEDPWFLQSIFGGAYPLGRNLWARRTRIEPLQGRRGSRPAAAEPPSVERKELARLALLGQLLDGPRGAISPRDWRRPATIETPSLKPRVYYRGVNLYERARTLQARLTPQAARQQGVRIFCYHRVADDGDVLAVRRDDFRRQMEAVLSSGAQVVRLDHAVELLMSPVARLYVCVTFDDGYRDTLDHAGPILADLGIPATVFLPTAIVDGRLGYHWYRGVTPPALDWNDVAELVAGGLIDVQSHSQTHPRLTALDERKAFEELAGSKQEIERHLGHPISIFSYPAGLYGDREARLVLQTGYRSAVTCRPGINRAGEDPTQLLRTMVGWGDDLGRFHAKLAGQLDSPSRLTETMQRWRASIR